MGLDKTADGYQEEGLIKLLKDIRDGYQEEGIVKLLKDIRDGIAGNTIRPIRLNNRPNNKKKYERNKR